MERTPVLAASRRIEPIKRGPPAPNRLCTAILASRKGTEMCGETHLEYRPKHTFFENVSYGNIEGEPARELLRNYGWKAF
jgi:hypothetical protein